MPTGRSYEAVWRWPGAELWSLREDVNVDAEPGDLVRLHGRWGAVTVARAAPVVRDALCRMSLGPISLRNVIGEAAASQAAAPQAAAPQAAAPQAAAAGAANGDAAARELYQVLDQLQPLVVRSLASMTGKPLLSVIPLTPRSRFRPGPVPVDLPVRLSTFAQIRTNGREYRLESPVSLHRVLLHLPEMLWLIGLLGSPITTADLAAALPLTEPVTFAAVSYLTAAEMVVSAQHDPESDVPVFPEDSDPALAGWAAVDLMFHTRSTTGRHDQDVGATYPLEQSPEPVVKPPSAGVCVPLYRPAWADLIAADPPLTVAIEGRCSSVSFGAEPVTADDIGELLYRTARVRSLAGRPFSDPGSGIVAGSGAAGVTDRTTMGLSDRPYPNGGSCYELELYLTIGKCTGIQPGIYHYDPLQHRLERLNAEKSMVDELLLGARLAANSEHLPPVLITMTARIQRISWKYEGLVYSLILKHAGVLTQNMYLVSTAMRLGVCALGSVSIEATARAFGVDWRTEPSVGQLIVGRGGEEYRRDRAGCQDANDRAWGAAARDWLRRGRTQTS